MKKILFNRNKQDYGINYQKGGVKERIAILGSTGSVGVNTLDVISVLKNRFKVVALSADSNIKLLSRQARKFHPKIIAVRDEFMASLIKNSLPSNTRIVLGQVGLSEIAARSDVDTIVFAISGTPCLIPLLEAIRKRKKIALANKEALVSAGPIIIKLARKNNVNIIPVDSEHSAIFQCLDGCDKKISRIYLTGSGGPLLNISKDRFNSLSRKFILNHPKWKMGKKISVDSATMMNKGLEIIEAKHLFGVDEREIEVLIHPEAIIHSMVEFIDGTILAQLGTPDMRLPIQYALTYPERKKNIVKNIDFAKVGKLSFSKPDLDKFPCLELARAAARLGGTAPAVLCACDEEVVKKYLEGKIRFSDITGIIEKVFRKHKSSIVKEPAITDILEAEGWAREETRLLCYR